MLKSNGKSNVDDDYDDDDELGILSPELKRKNTKLLAKINPALRRFGKEASILHQEAKQSLTLALKNSNVPDAHWLVALRQLYQIENKLSSFGDRIQEFVEKIPSDPLVLNERLLYSEVYPSYLPSKKRKIIARKLVMMEPSNSDAFRIYLDMIMQEVNKDRVSVDEMVWPTDIKCFIFQLYFIIVNGGIHLPSRFNPPLLPRLSPPIPIRRRSKPMAKNKNGELFL